MERRKNPARRSTGLALQIPVVVTSLDCNLYKECKTEVANAHGFGFVTRERLPDETPVLVKLVSNGANKKRRVVRADGWGSCRGALSLNHETLEHPLESRYSGVVLHKM
jgi:hypothetical protein